MLNLIKSLKNQFQRNAKTAGQKEDEKKVKNEEQIQRIGFPFHW